MNTQHSAPSTQHPLVPELGPALGRLTALPGARVGAPPRPRLELADLRMALVGRIFDMAGAARKAPDAAAASLILSPDRLRQEWERAATQASGRTLERIKGSLATAAERSGLPARRVRKLGLSAEESALISARLHGAGVPFIDALTALDVAEDGTEEWTDALLAAARLLESCWLELEQRALAEEEAWASEAARVAEWRPSRWPRWVLAGVLVALTLYVGLVLGGFLAVPPGAGPVAAWWWSTE